ncbi:MAG: hypothetical protein JSV19_02915 [Phycisphaerales bacterium]|nr:MAG: hypothetical protein JSV19_02915 [Phycisphaerales bacterium]
MRRRSRTRRILKWVGLVVCILLAAVWLGSLRWNVYVRFADGRAFSINDGGIATSTVKYSQLRVGVEVHRSGSAFPCHWWPHRVFAVLRDGGRETTTWWPIWPFFLAFAIPTAFLCHRDRRPPKGHCQNCGYDLTGNVSGLCPECGEPT